MMIIRPIQTTDYESLYQCAVESGIGFTSLPVNEQLLHRKIERATKSFAAEVSKPGSESYLFVMEDDASGEVVGTSGIEAAVGLDDAFYHYHMGKVVHTSRELNVYNPIDILTCCNDYTGVTEICTLFLREKARQSFHGRFLSKFRFLFLAEHSQRFADRVIAEMRGVSDEQGNSPFWKWLEEHFFSLDFPTVDYLTGIGQKGFIAELMPKYPIYVSLLSKEAQAVIGQVHEKTRPALQLLHSEGFSCRGYVDIFDAGPTVESHVQHIRTVAASDNKPVALGNVADAPIYMLINTRIQGFRGVAVPALVTDESIQVGAEALTALQIEPGDRVRFAPIKL